MQTPFNHVMDLKGAFSKRRDGYKGSRVGASGGAVRRRELSSAIAKDRRDAAVQAKRMWRSDGMQGYSGEGAMDEDGGETPASCAQEVVTAVGELGAALGSHDGLESALPPLRRLQQLLGRPSSPPLSDAVAAGAVPLLARCLGSSSSTPRALQGPEEEAALAAACCLTNIAGGEGEEDFAPSVLEAVPALLRHIHSRETGPALREQCVWVLGNMGGSGAVLRGQLLAAHVLPGVAGLVAMGDAAQPLTRTATWTLCNLIKGPGSEAAQGLGALPGLSEALLRHLSQGPPEMVAEAAWVLSYATSLADEWVGLVVSSGGVEGLMAHVGRARDAGADTSMLVPVLRALGNVAASDDANAQAVLQAGASWQGGACGALAQLLGHVSRTVQKESAAVLWSLSAASSLECKRAVGEGALRPLAAMLVGPAPFDLRKEAAFALANACVKGQGMDGRPQAVLENLVAVAEAGCVPPFVGLLRTPDAEMARLALQFVELALRCLPAKRGVRLVEEADGIDALEMLEYNSSTTDLQQMASFLVEEYYGADYGLEEEYGEEGAGEMQVTSGVQ